MAADNRAVRELDSRLAESSEKQLRSCGEMLRAHDRDLDARFEADAKVVAGAIGACARDCALSLSGVNEAAAAAKECMHMADDLRAALSELRLEVRAEAAAQRRVISATEDLKVSMGQLKSQVAADSGGVAREVQLVQLELTRLAGELTDLKTVKSRRENSAEAIQ
jgi:hypothetical protein